MSIPGGSNLLLLTSAAGGGGGGYEISRSLRFNSSDHVMGSEGYPSQNYDTLVNSATIHRFGADGRNSIGIRYGSNYLADVHFIDGQALDPSSFGEFDTNDYAVVAPAHRDTH
jgi:hypothetical protein